MTSAVVDEMSNMFGADSKFLSSLSDADQERYQELSSSRSTPTTAAAIADQSSSLVNSLLVAPADSDSYKTLSGQNPDVLP